MAYSSSDLECRDWANLPSDLIGSIAKSLYIMDHFRLYTVCTTWYSSLKSTFSSTVDYYHHTVKAPLMPYLLISDKGECGDSCVLLNLAENRAHTINNFPEIRNKWFMGSQFGWLITFDEFSNLSLLNPLTRTQIDLPPLQTLPFIDPVYDSDDSLVAYDFHKDRIWPSALSDRRSTENFRSTTIRKVVLSSNPSENNNYAVIAIFHCTQLILFVRPGEKHWNLLNDKAMFDDVIYRDGRFIAISNYQNCIKLLDLTDNPTENIILSKLPEKEDERFFVMVYLAVDSLSGDLLCITRNGQFLNKVDTSLLLAKITIHRFDPKDGTWLLVKSLGDQSIFIGNCYSKLIPAKDIPALKHDCIYFTDDAWDCFNYKDRKIIRDAGVVNVKSGSVERFSPPNNLQLTWPPPIFIAPTLW